MKGAALMRVSGSTGPDNYDFGSIPYPDGLSYEYTSNGGNDVVSGGRFDDRFILNSGAETINGRGGQDIVDYSGSTAAVNVDLRFQLQHGGWAEGDKLSSIEGVTGSRFGDTLVANDQGDVINGLGGDDAIMGGKGSDQLNGGAGRDTFKGLASGADVVSGGLDKDSFHFDIGTNGFNIHITDFNPLLFNDPTGERIGPSEARVLEDPFAELFTLNFRPESGVTSQSQADAAVTYEDVHPSDHDAVIHIDTPSGTHGTFIFDGLGD